MRLTRAIRDSITRVLVQNACQPATEAYDKACNELALDIVQTLLTKAELSQIGRSPKGWFAIENGLYVVVSPAVNHSDSLHLPLKTPMALPNFLVKRINLRENPELDARARSLAFTAQANQKRRFEIQDKCRKALLAVKTINQLKKMWPEIADVVELIAPGGKVSPVTSENAMVVFNAAELNTLLGLTGKTKGSK